MKNKIYYNYNQFITDIDRWVNDLEIGGYLGFMNNIYGIPRGGLVVATYLSYRVNKPLILNSEDIGTTTLIVDDIVDSGETLTEITNNKIFFKTGALWYVKSAIKTPNFWYREKGEDEWVVFPWEIEETSKYDNTYERTNKGDTKRDRGKPK